MNKEDIFKELRKKYKSVRTPKYMDFKIANKTLSLSMGEDGVLANMQENKSTFEGWVFAIFFNSNLYSEKIETVSLTWVSPKGKTITYNRFLYRVIKFQEKFNWFMIDDSKQKEVDAFNDSYLREKLLLNYPNSEAKSGVEKGEALIERMFFKEIEILKEVKLDYQNQQLPVGVFFDSVGKQNYFLTGNRSAIDLWGYKADVFYLFELKYKNASVGIISEVLFYCWILEDLIISKKINYSEISPKILMKNQRGVDAIYKKVKEYSIKKIVGVLLADEFHPIINDDLVGFVNSNLDVQIEIRRQRYIYEESRLILK